DGQRGGRESDAACLGQDRRDAAGFSARPVLDRFVVKLVNGCAEALVDAGSRGVEPSSGDDDRAVRLNSVFFILLVRWLRGGGRGLGTLGFLIMVQRRWRGDEPEKRRHCKNDHRNRNGNRARCSQVTAR